MKLIKRYWTVVCTLTRILFALCRETEKRFTVQLANQMHRAIVVVAAYSKPVNMSTIGDELNLCSNQLDFTRRRSFKWKHRFTTTRIPAVISSHVNIENYAKQIAFLSALWLAYVPEEISKPTNIEIISFRLDSRWDRLCQFWLNGRILFNFST